MHSAGTATHRCLLVVAKAGGSSELSRLRELRPGRSLELRVLAPAFVRSRAHFVAGDVEDAIRSARRRLDAWLDGIQAQSGIDGDGEVGDSDALAAIEASLTTFAAEEIVIVPSQRRRHRGEERLLERAWTHFDIPVLQLESPSGAAADWPLPAVA